MKACACCASAGGTYNLSCLDCCVRLVRSTHPDKYLAMGMLAVIERNRVKWASNGPRREQIIERLKDATYVRPSDPEPEPDDFSLTG